MAVLGWFQIVRPGLATGAGAGDSDSDTRFLSESPRLIEEQGAMYLRRSSEEGLRLINSRLQLTKFDC
jgi:hypothetical protein